MDVATGIHYRGHSVYFGGHGMLPLTASFMFENGGD